MRPRASPPKAAWPRCRSRAVAERAGIAAGTVYRYFPSKTDLDRRTGRRRRRPRTRGYAPPQMRRPGRCRRWRPRSRPSPPARCDERRLAWAVIAEPVDAEIDAMRLDFRQSLAAELEARIRRAIDGNHLPDQDARIAAPAIVGALMEGLIGPLAPSHDETPLVARSSAGRDIVGTARARRGRCARPRPGGAMCAAGSRQINLIILHQCVQRWHFVERQCHQFHAAFAWIVCDVKAELGAHQ